MKSIRAARAGHDRPLHVNVSTDARKGIPTKRWRVKFFKIVVLFIVMCCGAISIRPANAQQAVSAGLFDVFVNSKMNKNSPGLFFVDARTGLSSIAVTNGYQHTLLEKGVLFREIGTGTVKIAYPDGHIEDFPAIQSPSADASLRWIVSPNRQWIVWSASRAENGSLLSDVFLAQAGTTTSKLLLHASSTKGIDTLPLLVTDDGATAFYTRVAVDPKAYQLFTVAGDVFQLDTATGESTQLPNEAGCSCAAALSADGHLLARLDLTSNQAGFDLHFDDLSFKSNSLIKAPGLAHQQAGNLLFSNDNSLIVYTSAHGVLPTRGSFEQYALVVVDVGRQQQRILISPLISNLRAIGFNADMSAVLVVGVDKDGTYKVSLKDGTLLQVSAYTYLGSVTS